MRMAIDTNRYVDFARGDAEAVERVRSAHRVYCQPHPVLERGSRRGSLSRRAEDAPVRAAVSATSNASDTDPDQRPPDRRRSGRHAPAPYLVDRELPRAEAE